MKKEFNPDVSMTHLYEKAKGLYGDDLKAVVTDSLKHTSTSAKESVVKGDGDYMDEEDLIEKYKSKGKQKQYDAIKKNAHTFWDDQRECWLWEDIVWKRNSSQTEADKTETSKEIEKVSKIKPKTTAKSKAKKEPGANDASEDKAAAEAKQLSTNQLAKITKDKENLDKIVGKVAELLSDISDPIAKLLPPYVKPKSEAAKAKAEAFIGEIDMILESKEGVAKEINSKFSENKSELEAARKSLAIQLDEANKQIQ